MKKPKEPTSHDKANDILKTDRSRLTPGSTEARSALGPRAGPSSSILIVGFLLLFGVVTTPPRAYSQGDRQAARIEAELVTLRPAGFEPKEITRGSDPFVLAVDNRSGLEEIVLRLYRRAGNEKLLEVRVNRRKPDRRDLLALTPGQYVLSEANHPEWMCTLTINAH